MIIKKRFKNSAACVIGGKQPGEVFLLPVEPDGVTPADAYWRKRVADQSVALDAPETPPAKASRVAKASPAPDKGTV